MKVRVRFEFKAGVCLWADDAEARARWVSAVTSQEAQLPDELSREADALMARWDAAFASDDPGAGPQWVAAEAQRFHQDVDRWTDQVRAALARHGIELMPEEPGRGEASAAPASAPDYEGEVIACFTNGAACAQAVASMNPDSIWNESATWEAVNLRYNETGPTSPTDLLAQLESEPAFVGGWWQESRSGNSPLLAGDPVEHAIACLRTGNATGLANFLSWLRVQRVHLGSAGANAAWTPTPRHRLASSSGSFWEWWSFLRNGTAALQGRKVSPRYLNSERDRLFWRWTHGGSRNGWPAGVGEALESIGLRREAFQRWSR